MISLIKPHMSNQTMIGVSLVILRNPSGYALIKLERSIPLLQIMIKHEYVEYARMKSTIQVTKKAIGTLEKVKTCCSKCDNHLCGKHKFAICQTCFENK